jgi:hypothetical protein
MGPLAHTKGWSGSRRERLIYASPPEGVLAPTIFRCASAGAFFSISPEILKPIRRERRLRAVRDEISPRREDGTARMPPR